MSTTNSVIPVSAASRAQAATATDVSVATSRDRQTARPTSPFRNVLTGGVGLLARGAAVATSVVAGPVMAAAVREAGVGAANAVAGAGTGAGGRPPVAGGMAGQRGGGGVGAPVVSGLTAAGIPASGSDQGDLATMHSMQRESQAFNLQLLELQEDVQQENRRFTTVSNVLRAKHDTAKAAVSNIRA